MKKRMLAVFLALAMLLSVIPAGFAAESAASGTCGENVTWTLDSSGTMTISGTGNMTNYYYGGTPWWDARDDIKTVVIEEGVTSLGDYAFNWSKNITSVSLPDSLTTLGRYSLNGCISLTSVVVPKNVSTVDHQVFAQCSSLKNVRFTGSAPSFGNYVFDYDYLTVYYPANDATWTNAVKKNYGMGSITWKSYSAVASGTCGDNLTWMLDDAGTLTIFGSGPMAYNWESNPWGPYKENITNVVIGEGVTEIGEYAFDSFYSLESVTIPKSVESIGVDAFEFTPYLENAADENGLVIINNILHEYVGNGGDVVIPDGVTLIGEQAFNGNYDVTGVTIPDSVTRIEDRAFAFCERMYKVEIPETLTNIGEDAFYFTQFIWNLTDEDGYAVLNGQLLMYYGREEHIEIPNTVSGILPGAFDSLEDATSVVIPESVKRIEEEAFKFCWNLADIRFLGDAPLFGVDCFYDVDAIAYYPEGNPTWTEDIMLDYGGTVTWVPYTPPVNFDDVSATAYYADAVRWAVANGITNGTSANTFEPKRSCTRKEVVTFLWRAEGCPEPTIKENPFEDVKEGSYYYDAVLWAVENEITNGVSSTRFGSNEECTRAQVVTFLHRAANNPEPASRENPFKDIGNKYYTDAVLWAVGEGITTGTGEGIFDPNSICNRAQIVTFLHRAYTGK